MYDDDLGLSMWFVDVWVHNAAISLQKVLF